MKTSWWLAPFIIVSTIHLFGILAGIQIMHMASKPLLMFSLVLYFQRTAPKTPLNIFVAGALFFSLVGDGLLIFQEAHSSIFLGGLISFFIAHLLYIFVNINAINSADRKLRFHWADIPFVLYGLLIFSVIKDGLGDMYFPALAYTVVITIMGITARKRFQKTDETSFWLVMIGAIFFMISDSMLAINKFLNPLPAADFLIMLSYIIAQFLIIQGMVTFIKKIKAEN